MSTAFFCTAVGAVSLFIGMLLGSKIEQSSRPPTYEERWGDAYRFCLLRQDYPRESDRRLCIEAADRVLKCAEGKP